MEIKLRCNTLVRDFMAYKTTGLLSQRSVCMNEDTLLKFMQQLSRLKKWGEDALSPEEIVHDMMQGICMNIDRTYIRYAEDVPDSCMRF